MRLIIFSQPSVFVWADLRAHSFGFILTSPGLVRLVLFGSNPPCTTMGKREDLTPPPHSDNVSCTRTFDQACRLLMLDMHWKALGRALNLSQVAAQGDAA